MKNVRFNMEMADTRQARSFQKHQQVYSNLPIYHTVYIPRRDFTERKKEGTRREKDQSTRESFYFLNIELSNYIQSVTQNLIYRD